MDYVRVITIGPRRFSEAAITIGLSDKLIQQPKITYIISPYSENKLRDFWSRLDLDLTNYKFIRDEELNPYRPMLKWYREADGWFYQQALKLSALDILPHDRFLLQDCDCATVGEYEPWKDGKPNIRVEGFNDSVNPFIMLYAREVTNFLGISKKNDKITYTSELVPVLKKDWIALRERIFELHGTGYLEAIANHREINKTVERWFSEFELLGTWKENLDKNWLLEEQRECTEYDPSKLSTSDFSDKRPFNVLKFRASPMKYISLDLVPGIIANMRKYIDNGGGKFYSILR